MKGMKHRLRLLVRREHNLVRMRSDFGSAQPVAISIVETNGTSNFLANDKGGLLSQSGRRPRAEGRKQESFRDEAASAGHFNIVFSRRIGMNSYRYLAGAFSQQTWLRPPLDAAGVLLCD